MWPGWGVTGWSGGGGGEGVGGLDWGGGGGGGRVQVRIPAEYVSTPSGPVMIQHCTGPSRCRAGTQHRHMTLP